MKIKKCNICGFPKIWSKSMCKLCFNKKNVQKPIKKSYLSKKPTERALIKKEAKKEYTEKQFELFQVFYNEHKTKRCEQCNINISQCLSINVHHLLPKSIEKYKKIALDSRFWMLLCGNCHSSWENSNKGDKITIRTKIAKNEFNNL